MKLLVLDIETAPHVAYIWGLWRQNVPPANIIDPGYTLCFAARWLGENEILSSSIFYDGEEQMYNLIYTLLDQADGVITYNGERFDIPQLNRGMLERGYQRPSPFKQIDLYKVIKKHFKFASNSLDYVCKALNIGAKVPVKGMALWKKCMQGDPQAWSKMIEYNQQDVAITEKLYYPLLPWIDAHPNFALHQDEKDGLRCPKCGSVHLQKRGMKHTATQSYQQYQCQDCYSWFRERFTSVPVIDRKMILAEAK